MNWEVLQDKRAEAKKGPGRLATWSTKRLPKKLDRGWLNRLYVACRGRWQGYFPLSGEVLWNPKDETAPYTLILDARGWKPIKPTPVPPFRGWRYLASAPHNTTEEKPLLRKNIHPYKHTGGSRTNKTK